MPLCILASWDAIKSRVGLYMAMFLIMETIMIGVFMAQDLLLFYIFFEAGLIPMYFIIGIWGGANRKYAAFKFFLYTLLGSVLMLIAMIAMIGEAVTGCSSWDRSEEHTSELQSLMRISYAVFCLKKNKTKKNIKLT